MAAISNNADVPTTQPPVQSSGQVNKAVDSNGNKTENIEKKPQTESEQRQAKEAKLEQKIEQGEARLAKNKELARQQRAEHRAANPKTENTFKTTQEFADSLRNQAAEIVRAEFVETTEESAKAEKSAEARTEKQAEAQKNRQQAQAKQKGSTEQQGRDSDKTVYKKAVDKTAQLQDAGKDFAKLAKEKSQQAQPSAKQLAQKTDAATADQLKNAKQAQAQFANKTAQANKADSNLKANQPAAQKAVAQAAAKAKAAQAKTGIPDKATAEQNAAKTTALNKGPETAKDKLKRLADAKKAAAAKKGEKAEGKDTGDGELLQAKTEGPLNDQQAKELKDKIAQELGEALPDLAEEASGEAGDSSKTSATAQQSAKQGLKEGQAQTNNNADNPFAKSQGVAFFGSGKGNEVAEKSTAQAKGFASILSGARSAIDRGIAGVRQRLGDQQSDQQHRENFYDQDGAIADNMPNTGSSEGFELGQAIDRPVLYQDVKDDQGRVVGQRVVGAQGQVFDKYKGELSPEAIEAAAAGMNFHAKINSMKGFMGWAVEGRSAEATAGARV